MGRGEMGNGKLKRDEDLCMATCFENYRFLSLTQNGTNYKFIKKIWNRTDGNKSKQLGSNLSKKFIMR
jgi:hypothetical protein